MRQESRYIIYRFLRRCLPALVSLAISVSLFLPLASAAAAPFAPAIPANASCARLAQADPTATNGANWGATLLPGLGAPGGWFGVPVCANSVNQVEPGGANVSCDRVPTNFAKTGCAPGVATSDGYGLTFQCVELVARFAAWAFGSSPGAWHGDAPYLWLSGHHPASFSAYSNGGTRAPMPGDVLVWGSLNRQGQPWPAGPAGGHVAVVAAVGAGWITFVEENMLGRHGNIPKETTTLTESGGHWTIGPTYGTNGGRALYGWLHSSWNTGHFPGSSVPTASTAAATSTAQPTASSLEQGVIVTGAGALAQLVWSDTQAPDRPAASGQGSATKGAAPHALVESLGAPPGVQFAPNQTPAVVTLPTGERYSFVRGQDGRLYAAYTAPHEPGALWQALGAPTGVMLTSGATALWDGDNVVVGALGSDGALWIRTGPAGMLDGWVSLGRPANTPFQGTPALTRASGSSAHSATGPADAAGTVEWVALATGRDGALYEDDWRADTAPSTAPTSASATPQASSQSLSQAPGWSGWEPVAAPADAAPLTGALLVMPEPQQATANQPASAAPAIGAVNALATDATGRLWLLRRATMAQPWQGRAISLPDARATLLSAALTSVESNSQGSGGSEGTLQVYLSDPQVSASQTAGPRILTGALPLSPASASSALRWESLGAPSSLASNASSAAPGSPVALSFGQDVSALLAAQGAGVTLMGDQATLRLLAPGAKVASASSTGGAGSLTLGLLAPPQSFSDAFTGSAPDSRWVMLGASSTAAQEALGALALSAPTPSGITVATQGAPSGPFTVTVRVTPDTTWQAGSQSSGRVQSQAGILLALDDWNTLALSMRSDGTAALCPVVSGKSLACDKVTAPQAAGANQGLYLRISQSGADLTGAVSADGMNWSPVGSWRPAWLPSAETSPAGAYAPPVALTDPADLVTSPSGDLAAPLVFTSLGLFVENGSPQDVLWRQTQASAHMGASVKFSDMIVTTRVQAPR